MPCLIGIGRNGLSTLRFEARLHVLDRHVDPRREAPEDLRRSVLRAQLLPVDGDGEHPLVVGEDPAVDVEDPAAFRRDPHGARLGDVSSLLQLLGLHRLQEPQTDTEQREQDHADEGEHAEAGRASVNRHGVQSRVLEVGQAVRARQASARQLPLGPARA